MTRMHYAQYAKYGWLHKTADKLHDFLMNPKSRPDLQTPEGQGFLQHLEKFYHNDKTDALMPWLTREWKKGRIGYPPSESQPNLIHFNSEENVPHTLRPQQLDHWGDFMRSNHPIQRELGDIMKSQIDVPPTWKHHYTGEVYQGPQDHPADERLPDSKKNFLEHVQRWDQAMKDKQNEEALAGGEVVHTTPDGYTIRRLHTPEELKAEGDAMGHCVGGYAQQVANGDSMIYSLRDPQGRPHATTEIEPTRTDPNWQEPAPANEDWLDYLHRVNAFSPEEHEGIRNLEHWMRKREDPNNPEVPWDAVPNEEQMKYWHKRQTAQDVAGRYMSRISEAPPIPHGGNIVQIQGKGNEEPNPEYKKQLAHWFGSFSDEDRPQREEAQWNDHDEEEMWDPNDIEPHHLHPSPIDEYGLKKPPLQINWPRMIEGTLGSQKYDNGSYDAGQGELLHQLALAHGQIPEFGKAVNDFTDEANDSFGNFQEMNDDYLPPYPDEDDDEAMRAYEQAEGELVEQHPPTQAANHLNELLAPHWNGTTQSYQNRPIHWHGPQNLDQGPVGTFS